VDLEIPRISINRAIAISLVASALKDAMLTNGRCICGSKESKSHAESGEKTTLKISIKEPKLPLEQPEEPQVTIGMELTR